MPTNKKTNQHQEKAPQILVMEDDQSISKGLKLVLSEQGYQVELTETGQGALSRFEKQPVDLLVADLRLPDIDGLEVIKKIKQKNPETQVIVITGYGSPSLAVKAMKIGVHDFIAKPFTEDQIKAAVEKALKKRLNAGTEAETPSEEERLVQKKEVMKILNRTAEDPGFWDDLMKNGSQALEGYKLTNEAKAAIVSGDLKWINEHAGELTQKQLMYIYKRLEQEAW